MKVNKNNNLLKIVPPKNLKMISNNFNFVKNLLSSVIF